jgi:ribosomal 50S subunit-associated protein YjgA (DUF615 family)
LLPGFFATNLPQLGCSMGNEGITKSVSRWNVANRQGLKMITKVRKQLMAGAAAVAMMLAAHPHAAAQTATTEQEQPAAPAAAEQQAEPAQQNSGS